MVENEPVNPLHFQLLCYELPLPQRSWLIQTNRINAAVTNNKFETVQNTEQSQQEKGWEQPVVCLSLCISNSSKSCINWLELCGRLAERSLLGRWWRPGFHLRKWSYFQFSELKGHQILLLCGDSLCQCGYFPFICFQSAFLGWV